MKRRGFTHGAALLLSGCGFRPLYLPSGSRAAAELQEVFIPVLPERSGQLLRQALQQRTGGNGTGAQFKFELMPSLQLSFEGVGLQRDNSTSRIRIDASAPWTLRSLEPGRPVLAQGRGRALDGYNVINQQFFAAELESDAALRRLANTLADQIVQQVAIFFQSRTKPA